MEKEWESNKLNILINDCINIEKNINEINKINEGIKKMNSNQSILINFCPKKDEEINIFIDKIQNFGFLDAGEGSDIINKSSIIKSVGNIKFLIERLKNKENKRIISNLLFKASRDGGSSLDFHRKCDGKQQQLIFIKTKKGEIFGGYTKEGFKRREEDTKDFNSFVFSISKKAIYNIKNNRNAFAIFDSKERGPCFSESNYYIISIKKNMLKDKGNTCIAKESYYEGISQDYELNNGEREFDVQEIEVYQISEDNN